MDSTRMSGAGTGESGEVSAALSADSAQLRYRPVSAALAIAPTVSVVIPVKNEALNLPPVLDALPDWVTEVVLVDGRSVDDTVDVARRCRPDIKILSLIHI